MPTLIKKLIGLTFFVLVFCSSIYGQTLSRYDNVVFSQSIPVTTVAGATITVCPYGSPGVPCTPISSLYADPNGVTPLANPISSDAYGNYGFWAAPGNYTLTFQANGIQLFVASISMPGTGGGTIGGSGLSNRIAKFVSPLIIGISSGYDDNSNPSQWPNGTSVMSNGLYGQMANANPGTVVNNTVCRNSINQAIVCAAGTAEGLVGSAQFGAGNAGNVQVCFSWSCTLVFDNQTVIGDQAIMSATTAGFLHDTGSTTKTPGYDNVLVTSVNAGTGTTASVAILTPDTVNAGGGGGGIPGGNNTDIQFNNSGVFGGSDYLTWNGGSLEVGSSVGGSISINPPSSESGNSFQLSDSNSGPQLLMTQIAGGPGGQILASTFYQEVCVSNNAEEGCGSQSMTGLDVAAMGLLGTGGAGGFSAFSSTGRAVGMDGGGGFSDSAQSNGCATWTSGILGSTNAACGGGGGSGVSSLNTLTGGVTLSSSIPSVTFNPSGSTIDVESIDTHISNIQYVSSAGNDSHSGLSWATAKQHVYAALEALPGGSSSSPITAGTGTVYIGPSVSIGAADGKGLRIVGAQSTEYSSPATGWIRSSGALSLICQNGQSESSNSHIPQCAESWGSTNAYAAFQMNGTNSATLVQNFALGPQGTAITLGIDSTGNRDNGGAVNVIFKGVSGTGGASAVGWGPQVDIGSNVFWVFFDDSTFYGSLEAWNVSLSRSSNVVTATVIAGGFGGTTHDLPNGANVSIRNETGDTSFNGTYVIQSVPDNTHFTYNQTGPNATLSSAAALGDKLFGITVNPTEVSGTGSGLIEVNRMVGTGIKFYSGANGGSMLLRDFTQEGTNSADDPPGIWFTLPHGDSGGYVNHVEISDSGVNASAVVVDGAGAVAQNVFADFLYSPTCIYDGPMTLGGSIINSNSACPNQGMQTDSTSFRSGARGVIGGIVAAQDDDARRNFAPNAVRYANISHTASSAWTLSNPTGVTTTTGISAPDGTSGATSYTTTGVSGNVAYENASIALAVGDYFVYGVWSQSTCNAALLFFLGGSGNTANTTLFNPDVTTTDGQWVWTSGISKLTGVTTTPAVVEHYTTVSSSCATTAYAPIMIHIPTGTVTDNEAFEIAEHLQTYGSNCPVGGACQLPTQTFSVAGSTQFFGTFTHANTANRIYTFPDATGIIPYWTGTTPVNGHCVAWGPGASLTDNGSTCGSGTGTGTVSSVGVALTGIPCAVSGSPVTTTGILTCTANTQSANTFWRGPTSGSAATPTFGALVGADLPLPSASTLGGVESYVAVAHQWINTISTSGVPSSTQPAFTDISGITTTAQLPFTYSGSTTEIATVTGALTTNDCVKVGASGNLVDAGTTCNASPAFPSITGGTNTAAAMLVGTGASLGVTGTGTITATAVTPAGTLNDCVKWGSSGALADYGSPCGSGSSITVNGGSPLGSPVNFQTGATTSGITITAAASGSNVSFTATGTRSIAGGGTGQTTANAAFNALSPLTTEGDLIYYHSGVGTRIAIGVNGTCFTSNGTDPLWGSCATGTVSGSGATNFISKFSAASVITSSSISDNGVTVSTTEPISTTQTFTSTVATGTAPLVITSTTPVAHLTLLLNTQVPAINLAGTGNGGITGQLPIGNVGSAGLSGLSPIVVGATGQVSCPTCGTGTGNTTSTSLSTNVLPKANGANSLINSSLTDNGSTVSTPENMSVNGLAFTGSGTQLVIGGGSAGVILASTTSSNTDGVGRLTLSGGTASYTFTGTYVTRPVCVPSDETTAGGAKIVTTTTGFTITGGTSDVVGWICAKFN